MNVAELERLVAALEEQVYWTAHTDLHVTTISLARRVIAAEKLVERINDKAIMNAGEFARYIRDEVAAYEGAK